MEEIDLLEMFELFWRKKIAILIIILISIIAGSIYTLKFVTPKYSSQVTMVLVSSRNDKDKESAITTSDITLNSKLVSTYSKLIKSKTVLNEVISNLNIEIDENALKQCITVNSIEKTELIQITVTNEDNEFAANVANEIANVFPKKIKEMYNIDNIQLMSKAEIENEPSNINRTKDVLIFVALGIVISTIYVMISNMLDNTIKGPETIEKEFNLPVLTSIPILQQNAKGGNR